MKISFPDEQFTKRWKATLLADLARRIQEVGGPRANFRADALCCAWGRVVEPEWARENTGSGPKNCRCCDKPCCGGSKTGHVTIGCRVPGALLRSDRGPAALRETARFEQLPPCRCYDRWVGSEPAGRGGAELVLVCRDSSCRRCVVQAPNTHTVEVPSKLNLCISSSPFHISCKIL